MLKPPETFTQWLEFISIADDNSYYTHLLKFSNDVLDISQYNNSNEMQKMLRINAQQWSTIKKLLLAYKAKAGNHAQD